MQKITKPLLVSLVVIAVATYVYIMVQPGKLALHNKSIDLLRGLMQTNAELNADIVKIRQGALKNYDSLEVNLRKLEQKVDQLKNGEGKIYKLGDSDIDEKLDKLAALIGNKGDQITTFKLHNGLMRNSLDYLPGALNDMYQEELKGENDEVLHRRIEDALRFTIMYTIKGEEKWRRDALAHINWIRRVAVEKPRNLKLALRSFSDHLEVVITSSEKVNDLINTLSDYSTSNTENDLYRSYMNYYDRSLRQGSPYTTVLYALVLLLALYIAIRPLLKKED
ncbi:MAG: DAHL domain-containing protein [Pseudomonadota bacterium]